MFLAVRMLIISLIAKMKTTMINMRGKKKVRAVVAATQMTT